MRKQVSLWKTFRLSLCIGLLAGLTAACHPQQEKKWHIGVSQCSEDIWRDKQNRELIIGGYVSNQVELEFLSAADNDSLQSAHIDYYINKGVDLLIASPNQKTTLSAAIDKAYDKGIPVILFDRKTDSDKYTAYMGADNYEVGHTMGQLIATQLKGRGTVVEITGLKGSSPAIERHRGFLSALSGYPDIRVISSEEGDWTEASGRKAMEEILQAHSDIDCVFGHNDRLALGARQVALEHGLDRLIYYGVDALPTPGGGIECVQQGLLRATYIYPTQGMEVMRLALKILEGQPYERENTLYSAVVDSTNAELLLMQYKELERVNGDLQDIYGKLDVYFSQVNLQRQVIVFFLILFLIIAVLTVITLRSYWAKSRINDRLHQANTELARRHQELQQLYRQLEDMADARLVFFTNIGHHLRTPLTLIAGPVEKLFADSSLCGEQRQWVEMMHRNLGRLKQLVDEILDFRKIGLEQPEALAEELAAPAEHPATEQQPAAATDNEGKSEKPELLVVDDNADVRTLLKGLLEDRYHVTLAADGAAGLKEARRMVPDLIVSDVMMPVMDGLQLCREVKADPVTCHIPVLLLTARSLEEQRVEGYVHGADAYITKPFTAALLLARIENLLALRRTLRRAFAAGIVGGQPVQEPALPPDDKDMTFVGRLHDIIRQHLADADFGVERIGEEIGMSRVQLYRKTKTLTGMSPVEVLRKSRVDQGRRLLETTDKTISEIAYETGFSAPSYFAKCFKDEYGKTPGEWRG